MLSLNKLNNDADVEDQHPELKIDATGFKCTRCNIVFDSQIDFDFHCTRWYDDKDIFAGIKQKGKTYVPVYISCYQQRLFDWGYLQHCCLSDDPNNVFYALRDGHLGCVQRLLPMYKGNWEDILAYAKYGKHKKILDYVNRETIVQKISALFVVYHNIQRFPKLYGLKTSGPIDFGPFKKAVDGYLSYWAKVGKTTHTVTYETPTGLLQGQYLVKDGSELQQDVDNYVTLYNKCWGTNCTITSLTPTAGRKKWHCVFN